MIEALGVAAIGAVLTAAAVQDLKSREIDARIFAAGALPAALLVALNWGSPLYLFSLGVAAALALLMRLLGSGYADSISMALIGAAPPPLPFLPTPFVAVMAGSALLPAHVAYLYLKNRKRPCKMTLAERLTHICVSIEEFRRSPLKYVVGDVRDMERYDPSKLELRDRWIKAKYGLPYVVYLAAGYWAYVAIWLLPK